MFNAKSEGSIGRRVHCPCQCGHRRKTARTKESIVVRPFQEGQKSQWEQPVAAEHGEPGSRLRGGRRDPMDHEPNVRLRSPRPRNQA